MLGSGFRVQGFGVSLKETSPWYWRLFVRLSYSEFGSPGICTDARIAHAPDLLFATKE